MSSSTLLIGVAPPFCTAAEALGIVPSKRQSAQATDEAFIAA
jgi:hypothetical protein